MAHTLKRKKDIFHTDKFGIGLSVLQNIGACGIALVETTTGHNQEFFHKDSTFHYLILEGNGTFYLDDEPVEVGAGDFLSIEPNTRIYYKGVLKLLLITNPPWTQKGEVETKSRIW